MPGAPVSTPVEWGELENVYPTAFNIDTVPERVERMGDLWAGILESKHDLRRLVGSGVGEPADFQIAETIMDDKLSAEERDILERFERAELRSAPGAEREVELARQAARKTSNKTRRVNPSRRQTEKG